jgi:hypothetical protein
MITTLNAIARNPFIDGSSHVFNPLRGFFCISLKFLDHWNNGKH